jgi:hypothetical protein
MSKRMTESQIVVNNGGKLIHFCPKNNGVKVIHP